MRGYNNRGKSSLLTYADLICIIHHSDGPGCLSHVQSLSMQSHRKTPSTGLHAGTHSISLKCSWSFGSGGGWCWHWRNQRELPPCFHFELWSTWKLEIVFWEHADLFERFAQPLQAECWSVTRLTVWLRTQQAGMLIPAGCGSPSSGVCRNGPCHHMCLPSDPLPPSCLGSQNKQKYLST